MSDLVQWLNGCIDRAEQQARAAAPGPWVYQDIDSVGGGRVCDPTVAIVHVEYDVDRVDPRIRRSVSDVEADATGEYIAAHGPAWRLGDLARKRQILAEHQPKRAGMGNRADLTYGPVDPACRACGVPSEYAVAWPCRTVRLLAAEFAHEPGYDAERWAP